MDDITKLRMLIPHWMEHNQEHAGDFSGWAERLDAANPAAADLIRRAAREIEQANATLHAAVRALGGPLAAPHAHEH